MKVDRHIPVTVDKFVKVDRPYEVIKYVQEPYIVKVPKLFHVPIETKVAVPHPIVEIEPEVPEPQHIHQEIPPPSNDYLPPHNQQEQGPAHNTPAQQPPLVEHFQPEEAIPNPLPQPLPQLRQAPAPQTINQYQQYISPARAAAPPKSDYLPPHH